MLGLPHLNAGCPVILDTLTRGICRPVGPVGNRQNSRLFVSNRPFDAVQHEMPSRTVV